MPISTARPSTRPLTPWPVVDTNRVTARNGDAALTGGVHDRRGERMSAAALDSRSQPEQLGVVDTGDGLADFDGGDARLALGQRAGLVHDEHVHARELLECFGVLDEHTGVRAASGSRP